MAKIKNIFILYSLFFIHSFPALALENKWDNGAERLTGYGAMGRIGGNDFSDYMIRAQISREIGNRLNIGAVYSYDRLANRAHQFAKDAFLYAESGYGRLEAGWTESIAAKLALVLPDVGGTRMNNAPFFLSDDFVGITNPVVKGTQYAWRLNYASLPSRPLQIGLGRTIDGAHFKSSNDFGLRFRDPGGRTKSSVSLGFSYIEEPRGMIGDAYLPPVHAAARYIGTIGANIQSGSLVWAATGKVIVDKDPIAKQNGMQTGTGFSYDFLKLSLSANYIYSDIWNAADAHTGIISLRYKTSRFLQIWGSAGAVWQSGRNDFLAGGVGIVF